jgi:hypothetical protein
MRETMAAEMARCDECRRTVNLGDTRDGRPMAAADYGESHFFCDDCLTRLELEQAVVLGEIESIAPLLD